jgi:hypothetical protein
MARRERDFLEQAVHVVTEQAAKAGLRGCSDVKIDDSRRGGP